LFIGSSLWTNEPEWNNHFDLCDVTLTDNIRLTLNKTIYPVDILTDIIESNISSSGNDLQIGEQFSIKFATNIRLFGDTVKVYVTSTNTGIDKRLVYENFVVLGTEDYEYHFTGLIDSDYEETYISYRFDLNGTISSYTSTLLLVNSSVVMWSGQWGSWVTPFVSRMDEIDVVWNISTPLNDGEYTLEYSTDQSSWNPVSVNPTDRTYTIQNLTENTTYYIQLRYVDDIELLSAEIISNTNFIIKTKLLSSNRDTINQVINTKLSVSSLRNEYTIESVCYQARQTNYTTSTTLFDGTVESNTFMGTGGTSLIGTSTVVISTRYTFIIDETASQWVYYRFVGQESEIFEVFTIFKYFTDAVLYIPPFLTFHH
jgi:hypothetical protein